MKKPVLHKSRIFFSFLAVLLCQEAFRLNAQIKEVSVEEQTRYFHITYKAANNVPDTILVQCEWSEPGKENWQKAAVMPLISETALSMVSKAEWNQWSQEGTITERRASGLLRTIVFNPYPEAQQDGQVNIDFRIRLQTPQGKQIQEYQISLQADNRDVIYLEDWSQVLQANAVVTGRTAPPEERKWSFQTNLDRSQGVTLGNQLFGQSPPDIPLRGLTYLLDLKGSYAIYICGTGPIDIRLTGDEQRVRMGSILPGQERLWRWRRMDWQHLVLEQGYGYTGYIPSSIDYVKLVPLTSKKVEELQSASHGTKDKLLALYWEPYSWAFHYGCWQPLDHRKPLLAYKQSDVDLVEMQIGRFGMKSVYESRISEQLIHETWGDPIGKTDHPVTDNVGMMQQYTNTLDASLRYSRELGLPLCASFGASKCYKGRPLQGRFSKEHPEWMRGNYLRFEVPEVRQFVLDSYRECLEIGAEHLGVDLCRYPRAIDVPETCNTFLRELRELADEWGRKQNKTISITVRFPVKEHEEGHKFDFATWVQKGWVDHLIPSKLADRFYTFDITSYRDAVRGTKTKLLPCIGYDLKNPGLVLWRVRQLYQQGADGVYSYSGCTAPEEIRYLPILSRTDAVERWWRRDQENRLRNSKGIYITIPYLRRSHWESQRIRVWLEGIPMKAVEMYLDDKLISRYDEPPYTLGNEGHESDQWAPPGEHVLRIRAKDGDGWLEQSFTIPDMGEKDEWIY